MSKWRQESLKNVCGLINRGVSPKYVESGIIILNQKCIRDNRVNLKECKYSSIEKKVAKDKYLLEFDILVNSTGTGTLGRTAQIKSLSQETLVDTHITIVRPNCNIIDPVFVAYQIRLKEPEIVSLGKGATNQQELGREELGGILINIPPLPTQKRIASILSAYDDLIENNLKRIKLLEEIAQRTYEEWFVKYRVNGEQLAIDEVTGLPVGWEIIKVGDLLDKVKSTIKIPSSEIFSEGVIPVIDQSRDFVAGYTNEKLSILSLSKPIIVFGDHTRVIKFIDFPFARGADGTQLILSKNSRMPQHLFYHSLLNIDLSNYHYARHFKYLKDSEIIMPSNEYSEKFENLIKPFFEKIKVLRFQNVKLKQSRDILLPRLMSGTINVES